MRKQLKKISFLILLWIFGCQISTAKNVAQGKPVNVSSVNERFPKSLIVDGGISRSSTWMPLNGVRPPHWVEVNLQKYYAINCVVLYNGIPEEVMTATEKEKAGGFYCIKNLKLQYWDDANWTDFPNTELTENRKSVLTFSFSPSVTTYKIRLISTDGDPIRVVDLQVFGEEKGEVFANDTNFEKSVNLHASKNDKATITITDEIIGKSMKYVGYNQGYFMPGSNVSSWINYSQVNSLRVWASLNEFIPDRVVDLKNTVTSLEEFEALKKQLRNNPETSKLIDWEGIKHIASHPLESTNTMVLDYALSELDKLKIEVVLQINSTKFTGDWQNSWNQWLKFYSLAFYVAKTGNVEMYAMQNEPNHAHSGMKLDQYGSALKITSDAVRCAIADVNRIYGKNLKCKFVAPITAGTNTNWWASVIASVNTDYKGEKIDYDLLDIFSTHSYNVPALGYSNKVNEIRSLLVENHPKHKEVPVVFTEIGRWMNAYLIDREETMDSPSLFTEWAGIYSQNMNNKAYGMWAFKFANTLSSTYQRGIKSGHHYIWKGRRFLEDSQINIALGKPVKTSNKDKQETTLKITDGDKSDASSWTDYSDDEKWLEIDLQKETVLGGAIVYTGSSYGVYTSPDRIKNYYLQAWDGKQWNEIKGAKEDKSKYAQVLWQFNEPVVTQKVRLVIEDKGSVKIREIKLFGKDFMSNASISYDVSGIQRTGQVVRLFAKGFKNEKPLLKTEISAEDADLDVDVCFDSLTNMYHVWLVNRNLFDYTLNLDLSKLGKNLSTCFVEEVSSKLYGELKEIKNISPSMIVEHTLPTQSVQLISIPATNIKVLDITAKEMAVIKGGVHKNKNYKNTEMSVALNSQIFEDNAVSYIQFDIAENALSDAKKCVLVIAGYNSTDTALYRVHVYAIANASWTGNSLTWQSAPFLHKKEALMTNVGTEVQIVGEIVFDKQERSHNLDVTHFISQNKTASYSFVLIREPRELGDDYDKGKVCKILSEKQSVPLLKIFY